jgi:hypothetical protein
MRGKHTNVSNVNEATAKPFLCHRAKKKMSHGFMKKIKFIQSIQKPLKYYVQPVSLTSAKTGQATTRKES